MPLYRRVRWENDIAVIVVYLVWTTSHFKVFDFRIS